MHKTYADTSKLLGYTGGYWTYALNTNDTAGAPVGVDAEMPECERRLGIYILGWESIEVSQSLPFCFRT